MSVSSVTPISSVSAVTPTSSATSSATGSAATAATLASPGLSSNSTSSFSNLAVSLSEEAGVVATLSGATPGSSITAVDLYNNLANAVQSTAAGTGTSTASAGTSTTAASGTATTGTTANSLDVNTAWASLIKSNPSLAPLSVQLSEQQAIVNTFA